MLYMLSNPPSYYDREIFLLLIDYLALHLIVVIFDPVIYHFIEVMSQSNLSIKIVSDESLLVRRLSYNLNSLCAMKITDSYVVVKTIEVAS